MKNYQSKATCILFRSHILGLLGIRKVSKNIPGYIGEKPHYRFFFKPCSIGVTRDQEEHKSTGPWALGFFISP